MESLLGYAPDTWRFDERIDETTTDSRDGETIAADGIHFAGLSDGHRLAENGLPSNAQGRSAGRGRTDLDRVREESGVQSPVAHGSGEVRDVPRTAGAAGAYSEGGFRYRNPTDRDTDAGGQGSSACGRHVAGADLRAGLRCRFVWIPAGTIGAPSVGRVVEANDGQQWRLDFGSGHPQVFRHAGSCPPTRVSPTQDARRRAETIDWKMAQGGGDGIGERELSRRRKPARRRDFALVGQCVPALRAGHVVSAGGATATARPRTT